MRIRRGRRRFLVAGLLVGAAAVALVLAAPDSSLLPPVLVALALWAAVLVLGALAWLWRRLTYRVGVRLMLSYLLVGVAPFVVLFLLVLTAAFMLLGQYTSVRWGSAAERLTTHLETSLEHALDVYERRGWGALTTDLEAAPTDALARLGWIAAGGGRLERGGSASGLPAPGWVDDAVGGVVVHEGRSYLMAARRRGGLLLALLLPLDGDTARELNRERWYDVFFYTGGAGDREVHVGGSMPGEVGMQVGGRELRPDEIWPPWPAAESRRLLHRPLLYWFRFDPDLPRLDTGEPSDALMVTLLRTSPARVWRDFVAAGFEMGEGLRTALLVLGALFVGVYLAAALAAGAMTAAIGRSTARLSRGARELGRGNLLHRIPVKRRDQLGDLAIAFNRMADAVQRMLSEVSEKERLTREVELAREVQERLLPLRHLEHGRLTGHAAFRPAAHVGGDYFDLFPQESGRLLVAVGDVAGHGVGTGLLMAGLRAAVAALVREGYRGAALLERVNSLMLEGGSPPTMTTLVVVQLDPEAGRLHLAMAGHPPPLLASGGTVRELALPSLPLGSQLYRPRTRTDELPPEARLVLYTDGLVEAAAPDGEPFGYERLQAAVEDGAGLPAPRLLEVVLARLEAHLAGAVPADDLTVLVVEIGGAAGAGDVELGGETPSPL